MWSSSSLQRTLCDSWVVWLTLGLPRDQGRYRVGQEEEQQRVDGGGLRWHEQGLLRDALGNTLVLEGIWCFWAGSAPRCLGLQGDN